MLISVQRVGSGVAQTGGDRVPSEVSRPLPGQSGRNSRWNRAAFFPPCALLPCGAEGPVVLSLRLWQSSVVQGLCSAPN